MPNLYLALEGTPLAVSSDPEAALQTGDALSCPGRRPGKLRQRDGSGDSAMAEELDFWHREKRMLGADVRMGSGGRLAGKWRLR